MNSHYEPFLSLLQSGGLHFEQVGVKNMSGKMSVVSESLLMDLFLILVNKVGRRSQLLNPRDEFKRLLIYRCVELAHFKWDIDISEANCRMSNEVSEAPCLIINNYDLESQEEGMSPIVEEILGKCMPSNPIIIQEAEIEEMILKLQEKTLEIINSNISSFEIESVICLKVKKNEALCERGLSMFSFLPNEPKQTIDVKLVGSSPQSGKIERKVDCL